MVGSRNFVYFCKSDVSALQGHPRSLMLVPIEKRVCDFLLVRNSNLGPILHCFGYFAAFMCSWPHPYSTLILGVFLLHEIAHVGVSKSVGLKLFGREIIFEEFQPVWETYLNVTDGHTDRQRTCNLITALYVASRDNKTSGWEFFFPYPTTTNMRNNRNTVRGLK